VIGARAEREVELAQPGGVGDDVDFGDLPAGDDHPHIMHERAFSAQRGLYKYAGHARVLVDVVFLRNG
jgi:hypothetical protein